MSDPSNLLKDTTPGPWEPTDDATLALHRCFRNNIEAPSGLYCAIALGETQEEADANGRLIAAAPELAREVADLAGENAELRRKLEEAHIERDALFDEAKAITNELDAWDGSHWAVVGYEPLARWRAYRATLAKATAGMKTVSAEKPKEEA